MDDSRERNFAFRSACFVLIVINRISAVDKLIEEE